MRLSRVLSVLLALGSAYVRAEEAVVALTKDTFQEAIDSNEFILVEFYAPWCGHCKKLAPEYEKAAQALKESDSKVVLAKVDATAEDDLAKEFGVKGFPTLKWFVNGNVAEYTGGRDEKTILSWIQKKTGPPASSVVDSVGLDALRKESEAVVVGFFNEEKEAENFLKVAQTDDDTPYGICVQAKDSTCKEVSTVAGVEVSSYPTIVVYQDFDEGKAIFSGDIQNQDEIKKFISGNSLPLVIPFSQKVAPKIFGGSIKTHLLIFVGEDESKAKPLLDELKGPAKEKAGEVLFVSVNEGEKRLVEFFGVKSEEIPTVRLVQMGEGGVRKFKFTENEITSANVNKFLKDFFDGKVKMDLKSEEIVPEDQQENVRVVVGKDFEDVVNSPGKDVLVEFYAPWCGHCKKLEPEYKEVGEHFKDNDKIIIAKMDATANEVERVQISGFPTLKFFPADSDEVVDYDGARDKAGIIKFLEENAKSLK